MCPVSHGSSAETRCLRNRRASRSLLRTVTGANPRSSNSHSRYSPTSRSAGASTAGCSGRTKRAGGNSVARVPNLIRYVRDHAEGHSDSDVESALDDFIERHGGTRRGSIDLDNLPSKLWDKIRGKLVEGSSDYYELPASLFDEAGRRQTKINLPPS